jgi:hypothetical protein
MLDIRKAPILAEANLVDFLYPYFFALFILGLAVLIPDFCDREASLAYSVYDSWWEPVLPGWIFTFMTIFLLSTILLTGASLVIAFMLFWSNG